jgi:hypothetical protein
MDSAECILILEGRSTVSSSYQLVVVICTLNHTVPGVSYHAKFNIHMLAKSRT